MKTKWRVDLEIQLFLLRKFLVPTCLKLADGKDYSHGQTPKIALSFAMTSIFTLR
jgi:hypothetical protein